MIVIFTGRSGSGKTTMEKLLNERKGFERIKSCTSRPLRDNETEDDYTVLPAQMIHDLLLEGKLMEINIVYNTTYGMYPPSTDKCVCVCEKVGIPSIKDYVSRHPIIGEVVVIYLDAPREVVEKRIPGRQERLDMDDVKYSEENFTIDDYDYRVDASQSIKDVFKDICNILKIDSVFDNYKL